MNKSATSALLAAALVFAATGAAAQGTATLPGGLTLTDATLSPATWSHGTVVRRLLIENPTALGRSVTVEIPGEPYSSGGLRSLQAAVTVAAGMRTSLVLPQPPVRLAGDDNTVGVRVEGERRKVERVGAFSSQLFHRHYSSFRGTPSVLLSRRLSGEALKERLLACARVSGAGSGSKRRPVSPAQETDPSDKTGYLALRYFNGDNVKTFAPYRHEGDAAAWPGTWLAFSAFDGCVIDARDFAEMPTAARESLRAYAAVGGRVVFMGMAALPEGWTETAEAVPRLFEDGAWREAPLGFGAVCAVASTDFSGLSSNGIARLYGGWSAAAEPLTEIHNGAGSSLKEIPVAGDLRIPVGRFLLILFAFAMLAGPGAVLYTSRRNRRIWLLALVPAVSLLFSAAILAAALLSEGITPSLRRQALTLLDQPRRQAATLGAVGIYAPVSLRDGLHFDGGTEVTPLSAVSAGRIVCGRGQHYAEGWVTPRLPAFFNLRRSETRGERLLVEVGAERVEVVNGLGAPIRRLWLCDAEGRLHAAHDLKPGEKRALESLGPPDPGEAPLSAAERARDYFGRGTPGWDVNDWHGDLLLRGAFAGTPGPGMYVAVLDGCPFLEDPLAYCRTKRSEQSIVVGRY